MSTANRILDYAKSNMASFERGGVSSNEIRFFEYGGKKYVLKSPLMVGDNHSPFWRMMKNLFNFTFEKQYTNFESVYNKLKCNPHIPVSTFVAADKEAMVFGFVEGQSWFQDEFPKGKKNAYRLGQYIGYNHQNSYQNCGVVGDENVGKFFSQVFEHMKTYISDYWNSEEKIDKKVSAFYQLLKEHYFESCKYSYQCGDECYEEKEVLIQDPDGYLLRFSETQKGKER